LCLRVKIIDTQGRKGAVCGRYLRQSFELMKTIFLFFLSLFLAAGGFSQTIMSYNIRNAKGMDNVTDYDRIAAAIKKQQPDIVALQELDSITQRSKGVDVLKTVAEKTGMQYSYSASIDYNGGKYGIGLLSKEKPLQVSRIPLPGKEELRSLLIVEFKEFVVFNTHLSLTAADQLTSVLIINEQLSKYQKPVYLAGDLNATPESSPIAELKKKWVLLSGTSNTFPATTPDRCIDYIFGYGAIKKLLRTAVPDEPMASDHRPVLVVLQ
jgi:endonuclease/exonuclease/phosphatase family metal-dependent hydrolase